MVNFWTRKEESDLRKMYGKVPTAKIVEILKRSKIAIYTKSAKMGLNKERPKE